LTHCCRKTNHRLISRQNKRSIARSETLIGQAGRPGRRAPRTSLLLFGSPSMVVCEGRPGLGGLYPNTGPSFATVKRLDRGIAVQNLRAKAGSTVSRRCRGAISFPRRWRSYQNRGASEFIAHGPSYQWLIPVPPWLTPDCIFEDSRHGEANCPPRLARALGEFALRDSRRCASSPSRSPPSSAPIVDHWLDRGDRQGA
jgi:hypothetical protein